jgi:hypothetical protein
MMPPIFEDSKMSAAFRESIQDSKDTKKSYEEKLESARGADVFKYVLLINTNALEGYVAQSRLQAQQSFNLSKIIAVAGFVIIMIAICLSIVLTTLGNNNLDAAYLSGIAGILTEFTSGVFFYLYNKTLSQINLFHDKLADMQKTSLQHIAQSIDLTGHKAVQTADKPESDGPKYEGQSAS